MISNFCMGKFLIVKTGVYSDIKLYVRLANLTSIILKIKYIKFEELNNLSEYFDWIIGCPVETSVGFRIPIRDLYKLKKDLELN